MKAFGQLVAPPWCNGATSLTDAGSFPTDNVSFPTDNVSFPTDNVSFPTDKIILSAGKIIFPAGKVILSVGKNLENSEIMAKSTFFWPKPVLPVGLWSKNDSWASRPLRLARVETLNQRHPV